MKNKFVMMALVALLAGQLQAATPTVVGFDGGSDDGFTGNAFFEAAGGNPDGNAHHFAQIFFNEIRTGGLGEPANPDLLGDYSALGPFTLSLDIKVDSITDFIGNEIVRPIGFSLRDRDIQGPSGDSGVFFTLDDISSFTHGEWTTLSVTVDDPTSSSLPPGWIGFGDEDPNTFEPILPAGASFASVLAGVDELQITGAVPGFFFTFANYDLRIDNITLSAVPEPSCGCLWLLGLLGLRFCRRGH